MNENTDKILKIKLNTIINVIIIIVALIILTGLIIGLCIKNNKIKKMENTISELKSSNQKMKNIIEEELGEDYLNIKNTFDDIDDLVNIQNTSYDDAKVESFSDDMIKETITNYIKINELYNTSKEKLLLKLGLTNSKKIEDYGSKIVGDEYYSTDIKFEDYKNAMLQYMTEECFKDNYCDEVKSIDGVLYYSYAEASDPRTHEILSMNKDEYEENSFNITLKEKIQYSDMEEEQEEEIEEALFTITSRDGKGIVKYTDFLI